MAITMVPTEQAGSLRAMPFSLHILTHNMAAGRDLPTVISKMTLPPDWQTSSGPLPGKVPATLIYSVFYSWQKDTIFFTTPEKIKNISFCNSTYAYYSMLNGDQYAKKFGGESGNDPDYFKLIVEGLDAGKQKVLSGEITLADYTPEDNSKDYIGNVWTDVDLSQAGYIKYLVLSFESSDTGAFGINTPTFVCIDNIFGELQE